MFLRRITVNDLEDVLLLQDEVIASLSDPSLLRKNSEDLLRLALSDNNICLGLYDGDTLAALIMAVDPVPPETDLRTNLRAELDGKAIDFKLVLVKKEYRGHGIQIALMWIIEKLAYNQGIEYFVSSVSPDNKYSVNNFIKSGYIYDHEEELYGGLLRSVYIKELEVYDYYLEVLSVMNKLYETESNKTQINKNDYILGDIDIATTGDVLEYTKDDEVLYALVINNPSLSILISEDGIWKLKLYEDITSDYELKNVWINPNKDVIPFE